MRFIGKRRNKIDEIEEKSEDEQDTAKLKINLGQLLGGTDKDPRIIGLF